MNGELLRLVDSIHRDKDIDKEIIFRGIEDALLSAARKRFGQRDSIMITIDRESGDILAFDGDDPIDPADLGRIAAQTAKQVIIHKIREAESEVIFEEFEAKLHDVINGTVQRVEGSTVIFNLGKVEGIMPKREQVPDDTYRPGDRVKCYVLGVKKDGQRVKVLLSRTHPDIVKRLFEIEVPEVADRVIEIKGLAREPGSRTKIAVLSSDTRVDCVGACVGVRGSRIKNIVAELGGEKIDIVPWSPQPEMFISKALSPAEIYSITLNPALNRAKVVVPEDQLSLAIGKKGQNVRLAARLTKWAIDVMSKEESDHLAEQTTNALSTVEGVSDNTVARLARLGYTITDLARLQPEDLIVVKDMSDEEAVLIVEGARRVLAEGPATKLEGTEQAEEEAQPEVDEQQEQTAQTEEPAAQADESVGEPEAEAADESAEAQPAEASEQIDEVQTEQEQAEDDDAVSESTEEPDADESNDTEGAAQEAEEETAELEQAEEAETT